MANFKKLNLCSDLMHTIHFMQNILYDMTEKKLFILVKRQKA